MRSVPSQQKVDCQPRALTAPRPVKQRPPRLALETPIAEQRRCASVNRGTMSGGRQKLQISGANNELHMYRSCNRGPLADPAGAATPRSARVHTPSPCPPRGIRTSRPRSAPPRSLRQVAPRSPPLSQSQDPASQQILWSNVLSCLNMSPIPGPLASTQ